MTNKEKGIAGLVVFILIIIGGTIAEGSFEVAMENIFNGIFTWIMLIVVGFLIYVFTKK